MKEAIFDDEQRRIVARRIRTNRKARGLTQAEVAHLSGVDEKVVKNIERAKAASAVSYKSIGQVVGLKFEDLLEFASINDEIQELINDLEETQFTAPHQTRTFAAQFSPMDPDSFAALHQMGLTISGNEFTLFDVLVKYKGDLDVEFATYLKEMGLELDQRLFIHSFAVLYYVFSAVPPWQRGNMHHSLDKMMSQVQEFIEWQEAREDGGFHHVDPVTGDLNKQEPNPRYRGTRKYRESE